MTPATATSSSPAAPVQRHGIGGRRAFAVWGTALGVYVLGIFHRTSLGVAGLVAADRFHISAAQLATFTVVQLLVYAALQVPVGVLLDRFGSKRLLLAGVTLMSLGQLWFAVAGSFEVGLAARVLLGAGDAMVFVSVMRIVALWFRVRQAPLLTQLTGQLGQVGAIAASFPLAAALTHLGWTRSFTIAAGLGVVAGAALLLVVKDSPYEGTPQEPIRLRAVAATLRDAWGTPGTRLGLWSHFTAQFSPTVFTLLWGYPFLVRGEGLDAGTASALLVVITLSAMVTGPLLGQLVARHPYHRSQFVLVIVGAIAAVWTAVLTWPGRAPLPLLVLLVVVSAVGGPGSMVGLDLARSFNPQRRLGSALGIANIGGFVASLAVMALVGLVLDHLEPRGPAYYDLGDFRWAFAVQYLFWAGGGLQVWRHRRRTRRHLRSSDPEAFAALRRGEPVAPR
ncbi:MFS transporter [Lapillicoccus jejuensis]|uniref:Putative MFS family arabinose efflux permease n=1 Tax=Lapillicoccus jejuensis TaxID=402171 RepID=A0A542E052_9MICO|nr:MFS transporter [Lapillicoccus jejuensis]TQJ08554.1 putative MFS family arabinose efflux permease [Lapillicoccus jejuensis]